MVQPFKGKGWTVHPHPRKAIANSSHLQVRLVDTDPNENPNIGAKKTQIALEIYEYSANTRRFSDKTASAVSASVVPTQCLGLHVWGGALTKVFLQVKPSLQNCRVV